MPTNKYYVSILTEYEYDIPYRILDSNKSIGLDYSSSVLYVDSNGNSINMPHYYRLLEERLLLYSLRRYKHEEYLIIITSWKVNR